MGSFGKAATDETALEGQQGPPDVYHGNLEKKVIFDDSVGAWRPGACHR